LPFGVLEGNDAVMAGHMGHVRHLLGTYVLGGLDPDERSLVEQHLGECQSCRMEHDRLQPVVWLMDSIPLAQLSEWLAEPPSGEGEQRDRPAAQ
jgi:anti-sigma factor RsiW